MATYIIKTKEKTTLFNADNYFEAEKQISRWEALDDIISIEIKLDDDECVSDQFKQSSDQALSLSDVSVAKRKVCTLPEHTNCNVWAVFKSIECPKCKNFKVQT